MLSKIPTAIAVAGALRGGHIRDRGDSDVVEKTEEGSPLAESLPGYDDFCE